VRFGVKPRYSIRADPRTLKKIRGNFADHAMGIQPHSPIHFQTL